MPRSCRSRVVQLSCFFVEFVWFVIACFWTLCFSVALCKCYLWSFLIRRWKLKNASTKWQPPSQFGALHVIFMVSLRRELIQRLVLIIHSDEWIFSLIVSPLVPLRPLVGLRPPSKNPSSCHSTLLCLPYLSPFCPRHNSLWRSLFMRVLSHLDTHYLNRHMAKCGCHEILTRLSLSILFWSNFFDFSVPLCECLLWLFLTRRP